NLAGQQQIDRKDDSYRRGQTRGQAKPAGPQQSTDKGKEQSKADDIECAIIIIEHAEQQIDLAPQRRVTDCSSWRIVPATKPEGRRSDELRQADCDPAAERWPVAGAEGGQGRGEDPSASAAQ